MTGVGTLRRLAVIEQPTEAETAFGGRTVSWAPAGSVWLAMGERRANERAPGAPGLARDVGAPERLAETAEAEAREHPGVLRGRRLSVEGDAWRVVAVDRGRPRPGRMMVSLARD